MPLFKEKKENPGGLGAKGKSPDLYSSVRRVQTSTKGWWNSPKVRKARRNFWKTFFRKAGDGAYYIWDGE